MADRKGEDRVPPPTRTTATTAEAPPAPSAGTPEAVLTGYSLELLKCIEEMRYKRDVLHKEILNEHKEKARLQADMKLLTDKLVKVNESLCDKMIRMDHFNKAMEDTERAFSGLVIGSEHLLINMKKITDKYMSDLPSPRTASTGAPETGTQHSPGSKGKRYGSRRTEPGSTPRR